MVKKLNPYVPVKLPRTLVAKIDEFVGKYGYRSRAEFVKDGCRSLLREYMTEENPKGASKSD